jgi:hypothetical protein
MFNVQIQYIFMKRNIILVLFTSAMMIAVYSVTKKAITSRQPVTKNKTNNHTPKNEIFRFYSFLINI